MLFVDLDGLKMINDRHGHLTGDAALIQVAALLVQGVRHSRLVARIGGDEFGVLLDMPTTRRRRRRRRGWSNQIAAEEFFAAGTPVPLSVAIGFTLIETDDTPGSVLARADHAMYQGKAAA